MGGATERGEREVKREVEKRRELQQENQEYIEKNLKEVLQKMMVATLNLQPKDPAQYMIDYLNLHYYYQQSPQP